MKSRKMLKAKGFSIYGSSCVALSTSDGSSRTGSVVRNGSSAGRCSSRFTASCARLFWASASNYPTTIGCDLVLPPNDLGGSGDTGALARLGHFEVCARDPKIRPLNPLKGLGPKDVEVADRRLQHDVESSLVALKFRGSLDITLDTDV